MFQMDYFVVRNGILCAVSEMLDYVAYEEEVSLNGDSAGVPRLPPGEQDSVWHGGYGTEGVAPGVDRMVGGAAGTWADCFRVYVFS